MPTLTPIPTTAGTPKAAPSDAEPPKDAPKQPALNLTLPGDSLVLSPAARARRAGVLPADPEAAFFDTIAFDSAWEAQIKPALSRWPERDTSPVAIQQLRYADLVAGGRETEYTFERDPGQLMPPMGLPQRPLTDPRTGEQRLELREARVRVSAGRYDLIVSIDGDGRPSFEKLFLDGKNITRHAGDFVKGKIKEEPMIWGPVAVAAVAGVVAVAHNQAAKTGKPIGFDAAKLTVYRQGGLEVKAKLRAELTGTSQFVRASGAEIGTTYHDGRLVAATGLRYATHTKSFEVVANMGYQIDRQSAVSAGASYNQHTKEYAVGLSYQASF